MPIAVRVKRDAIERELKVAAEFERWQICVGKIGGTYNLGLAEVPPIYVLNKKTAEAEDTPAAQAAKRKEPGTISLLQKLNLFKVAGEAL